MDLLIRKCVPCQGGMAPMPASEAESRLASVSGWELQDEARKLRRTFMFADFIQAQDFAVRVGGLAQAENHHPDISYGWGYCTVLFYTHKIGGLHDNDFIMAAKVNALAV